jgi:type II secretory pathway pseudopilin PulG
VIAIIAILASLLLPALGKAKDQAKRANCMSNLRQLGIGITAYAGDNDEWVPAMRQDNVVTQNPNHWARWFRTDDLYWNLGHLWITNMITSGELYFCPAQPNKSFQYEYYASPEFPTNVGAPPAAFGVRLSYYYNPMTVSAVDRRRLVTRMAQFSSDRLMAVDSLEDYRSIAHGQCGWNVMLGDGSVTHVVSSGVRARMIAAGGLGGSNFGDFDDVLRLLLDGTH